VTITPAKQNKAKKGTAHRAGKNTDTKTPIDNLGTKT
jgi:hypothetical protein